MLRAATDTTACLADQRDRRTAVSIKNVSKVYPKRWIGLRKSRTEGRHALRDVSFDVGEGEMIGLLGPNGAGKTTLLKSIATLLQPSSGQIIVAGVDIEADPVRARRLMGLVTCDERSFYWRLTGRQNLNFFASLYGVPERVAYERIPMLFEKLSLSQAADVPYQQYSTGMRQKMAIARGLLADPKLILYDEPTRSLDPLSAQKIRDWIRSSRLASPTTTHLIATNQLREAEQLCDRVVIMDQGSVIADGSVSDIRRKFGSRETMVHLITCTGLRIEGGLRPIPENGLFDLRHECDENGVWTVRATTSDTGEGLSVLLSELLRSGGSIVSCETEQMRFDEVFCSLILAGAGRREP